MTPKLKCLTLYAGAGGADLGLLAAGVEHVACVDANADCVATLRAAGLPGIRAGTVDPALADRYRDAMQRRWGPAEYGPQLGPGNLWAAPDHGGLVHVLDGDSILCACSVADAAAGRCHRAWAAPVLVAAGWRVVLDGREVGA